MTEETVAERYVVNINRLECIVMREFCVPPHAFKNVMHNKHAARSRWTLWHFLCKRMGWAETEVGRLYGKHASTVHSGVANAALLLHLRNYPQMTRATATMLGIVQLHDQCFIDWGMGPRLCGPLVGEPR